VPEGGEICLRVHDKPGSNGDYVRIDIADNGRGIPDEIIPKLFHPFFTTKKAGGNGLGLWVSRGLVEKHGGTIDTNSLKAGASGAVFTVVLPTEGAAPDLMSARPSQEVSI
jgi:signal transduction histidine kinase